MLDSANLLCFDCGQQNALWGSVSLGAYICANCASIHRGLGLQVKSTRADRWEESHLKAMTLGGNQKLKKHFSEFDLLDETPENRYKTVAAHYYRRKLDAELNDLAFIEECPSFLEGKTIMDTNTYREPTSQQDSDEGEIDPVDPLVDMFWSGVKATEGLAKSVIDQTEIVKISQEASGKLFEQSQPLLQKTAEVSKNMIEGAAKVYDSADQMTGGRVTEAKEMAKSAFYQMASYGSTWFSTLSQSGDQQPNIINN